MERKEDTPVRKTRRKYEEKNKEKRKQASGNFGTMIPRALFNEINEFLEENDITKVRLIKEGYEALKKKKDKNNNKIDDIEDIYEWIDYVRKMGIEQSFKSDIRN